VTASWDLREGHVLDCLREMDAGSVQCCITSPPYFGLRDYQLDLSAWGDGWVGCLGLEPSVDQFVVHLVEVFSEVRRVLADDGTLWLNLGDSYAGGGNGARDPERWPKQSRNNGGDRIQHAKKQTGAKSKDLLGVPWATAFALRADGWYLRQDIIWNKPNPMPESVTDRPTTAHEHIFLLAPSASYFYDAPAIREQPVSLEQTEHNERYAREYATHTARVEREGGQPGNKNNAGIHSRPGPPGRNKPSVWTVAKRPYPDAHFATFPPKLIEPMVLAGCPAGGTILDPFAGSGTTLQVAVERGRNAIGIELKPEYAELTHARLAGVTPPLFAEDAA